MNSKSEIILDDEQEPSFLELSCENFKTKLNTKQRRTSGNYSHVESKVKQYRIKLNRENNQNKTNVKEETETVITDIDLLMSELEIKTKTIDVLQNELEKLCRKYTELQISNEKFRLENSRLQQALNTISCTPKTKGNPIFTLYSPFNVITSALKTPCKNISEYSISESDICSEDIINVSINTTLETTEHFNTPNIYNFKKLKSFNNNNLSLKSDEPLLNQTISFGKRAKKVLLKFIMCNKKNNSICSDTNIEQMELKLNSNKIRTIVKPRSWLKKPRNSKKSRKVAILSSSTPSFPLSAIKSNKMVSFLNEKEDAKIVSTKKLLFM